MANFFGGLARGLGAAVQGAQAGQIKGQEAVRQRSLQEQDRKYKQSLIDAQIAHLTAQKHEPSLEQKTASSLYEKTSLWLHDPANADYWNQNPKTRAAAEASLSHYRNVIGGTEDLNVPLAAQVEGAHDNGLGDEALGGGGPAGPSLSTPARIAALPDRPFAAQEPSAFAPLYGQSRGPQIGMTPTPPLLANSQLTVPPHKGPTFSQGNVPVETLANTVFKDIPGAPRFAPPAPPKPTAAPTSTGAPPPEAPSPIQRFLDLAGNAPNPVQRPGETPKAFEVRQNNEINRWQKQVQIAGMVPIQTARGIMLTQDAAAHPEILQEQSRQRKAATARNVAATETDIATRPGKVANLASEIRKRSDDTKIAEKKFTYQQKQDRIRNDIAWMNARTSRAAQQGRQPYLDAMTEKAKYLLAHADDPNQREVLKAAIRLYTASRGILDDPQLDQGELDQTGENIDAIAMKLGGSGFGLSKGGGKTAPAPKTITPKAQARAVARNEVRQGVLSPFGGKKDRGYWGKVGKKAGLTGPGLDAYLKSKGF